MASLSELAARCVAILSEIEPFEQVGFESWDTYVYPPSAWPPKQDSPELEKVRQFNRDQSSKNEARKSELRNEFAQIANALAVEAQRYGVNWEPIMRLATLWKWYDDSGSAKTSAAHLAAIERSTKASDGVEKKSNSHPRRESILQILGRLKPGHGLNGKEILNKLPKYPPRPAESTMRKYDLSPMVKSGQIISRRGIGYSLPPVVRE